MRAGCDGMTPAPRSIALGSRGVLAFEALLMTRSLSVGRPGRHGGDATYFFPPNAEQNRWLRVPMLPNHEAMPALHHDDSNRQGMAALLSDRRRLPDRRQDQKTRARVFWQSKLDEADQLPEGRSKILALAEVVRITKDQTAGASDRRSSVAPAPMA